MTDWPFRHYTRYQLKSTEADRKDRQDDEKCLHCLIVAGIAAQQCDPYNREDLDRLFSDLHQKSRESLDRLLSGESTYMQYHNLDEVVKRLPGMNPVDTLRLRRLTYRNMLWVSPHLGGKEKIWSKCQDRPQKKKQTRAAKPSVLRPEILVDQRNLF